jgi:hypothetical protein
MSEFTGPGLLGECLARLEWAPDRLAREINRTAGKQVVSAKAPYHWLTAAPRGAPSRSWPRSRSAVLSESMSPPGSYGLARGRRRSRFQHFPG